MADLPDFYDGSAEESKYYLDKANLYVEQALANGDGVEHKELRRITIVLRKPKEVKDANRK